MIKSNSVQEKRTWKTTGISFALTKHIPIVIIFILAALFLFPFYWMVTGSLKGAQIAMQIPPEWFPLHPTFDNYSILFQGKVLTWGFNSFFVSCTITFFTCLFSSMAGYALAKKSFPGAKVIFWSMIAAMTLPRQVLMVPLFTMLRNLNWVDTFQGLILPSLGGYFGVFGVFLMKQFTQTLPSSIIESANMDGCNEANMFIRIILPMVKPGIGALAIFTFMGTWNDYFWQLIVANKDSMKTLPLGIASLQNEFSNDYGIMMAGAALASAPMVMIFIFFQKFFTQGITLGSVKG